MIFPTPLSRRARYDQNGDIVLGESAEPADPRLELDDRAIGFLEGGWKVTVPPRPEDILSPEADVVTQSEAAMKESPVAAGQTGVRRHIVEDVLEEGLRQYTESLRASVPMLADTGAGLQRVWRFFRQPVWLPTRNNVRKTSRGMLFFTDTLQFGGTFAAMFFILFTALNYQSFWQIASSRVIPLLSPHAVDASQRALASALQDNLKHLPSLATAGSNEGNILSVLPMVGPPDNRLIIPKLDLNVPLVTPSYTALLAGDWTQVEKDIQSALENGVVHYPGTANPGQAGNVFITGHSSYYPLAPGHYKTVFARLHQLDAGDEYWIYFGGDKHRYRIRGKKEVSPSDITVLDQPEHRRLGTLMTCTPVGTSLRRLILTADEVETVTGDVLIVGERSSQPKPKVNLESLPI